MPLKLPQDNMTGLIWAAMAGNADVLNAFIEAGADIDAQDKAGHSFVCLKTWTTLTQSLLLQSGRTVLIRACNAGCVPAVEALIKAGAKIRGEREVRRRVCVV
jgi:ankyrin repeat protein